ncbi:MAG: hypothetical protein ACREIU_00755, partial [Planctomycetota bacterium]
FALTHFVAFTVTADGVETAFHFPGMPGSATTWVGDLELGTHSLTVRTLDREGLPVAAKVGANCQSLSSRAEGWGSVSVGKSATDARGEREIPHLCPGTYRVWAEFPSGFEARGELVVPDQRTVELRALEVGTIELEARKASGEPLEDAFVVAATWLGKGTPPADPEAWQGNDVHGVGERTDVRGQARLRGVAAGEVLVRLRIHPMAIPDRERDPHERLKLAQGETRSVRFEVP